jgi:GH25 family lysozyme M1 (1,4-beta-N-acetylmuramidase)
MKPLIDLSSWQNPDLIDYDVLASQVSGVILRAGYGTVKDRFFDRHYAEFDARGIPVGAYHYLQAEPAINQATALHNFIAGKSLLLGLWADVEANTLTRQVVLDYVQLAEAQVGELGIYTSQSKWRAIMGGTYLNTRRLWVANYGVNVPALPQGWTTWWLWQYSDKGNLAGYDGSLDMNRFNGTQAEFDAWVGDEEEDVLYKVRVITGALNVRSGPGLSFGKVDMLLYGATADVLEEQDGWLRIGVMRWISGNSLYVERVAGLTLEEKVDLLWQAHEELHP